MLNSVLLKNAGFVSSCLEAEFPATAAVIRPLWTCCLALLCWAVLFSVPLLVQARSVFGNHCNSFLLIVELSTEWNVLWYTWERHTSKEDTPDNEWLYLGKTPHNNYLGFSLSNSNLWEELNHISILGNGRGAVRGAVPVDRVTWSDRRKARSSVSPVPSTRKGHGLLDVERTQAD